MPTRDEIYDALRRADAAGDTQAVRRLSQYLSDTPPEDDSAFRGFVGGLLQPVDKLTEGALALPVVGPVLQRLDEAGAAIGLPTSEQAIADRRAAMDANTRTGWQTAGNVAGLAPLARVGVPALGAYGNAALQGAAGGALLSDSDTASGIVGDAAIGAATGAGSTAVLRGIANVAAPVVDKGVRALRDAGVTMTLGQLAGATQSRLGKAVKGVEDRLAGFPIVGEFIQHARDRGTYDYNRAVLNRALGHIGAKIPDDMPVGTDAIRTAGDQVSAVYDRVLPGLTATADRQFAMDLTATATGLRVRPDSVQRQFNAMMDDAFQNRLANGGFDGPALKEAQSKFSMWAAQYRGSRDPDQRALGIAAGEARDAIRDMVARQHPNAAPELQAADRAWRELAIIENAAGRRPTNTSGVFSPVDYRVAARNADSSIRRRATVRGTAPNQALTDAAARILPNTVPDSGTAGRTSLLSAYRTTTTALSGGAGAAAAMTHPVEAAVVGAAALPYTRVGQTAVNRVWTANRPNWLQIEAERLRRLAPRAAAPAAAIVRPRRNKE